jgi:ABC-type multidrug transport system fused ATPase/permease subunit
MISQSVRVMVDYWLSVWTQREYHLPSEIYLTTYASLAIGATILSIFRAILFTHATMITATEMHKQMAERVLRAPQSFFDQVNI